MAEKDWISEATKALESVGKKISTENKKSLKEVSNIIKIAFAEAGAEKDPDKKKEMQRAVQELMGKFKVMTTNFQSAEKETVASIKLLKMLSS